MNNHCTDYVTSITSDCLAAGASPCVVRANHYVAKSKHEPDHDNPRVYLRHINSVRTGGEPSVVVTHRRSRPSTRHRLWWSRKKGTNYEENDTKPNIHCHTLIYIYLHACDRVPWVRGDGKCVRECVREVREEEEVVRSLLVLLRR